MTNGFPTFDFGNVLATAENVQGARDARAQANAIAQRNAQGQVLLQNAIAGGLGSGQINALAGEFPDLAAGAQTFLESQQATQQQTQDRQREAQERETDENIRILDMLIGNPQGARKFRLLFPAKAEQTERIIIEAGGKSLDEMSNEEFQALATDIRTQLLPGASPALLKELGEEKPGNIIQFQNAAGETREVFEGSPEAAALVADPDFNKVGILQRLAQGTPEELGLAKPTLKRVQEDIINIDDSIARVAAIASGFDPRFLEFSGRLGATISAIEEKLGRTITPERRRFLAQFSAFQRDAIENINLEIKRITGAQMSEKEADRIRQGFPDPGEGIFDGDSPTVFLSKLNGVTKSLKLARARRTILLREGINLDALSQSRRDVEFTNLPLQEVERRANIRALELRAQGADDATIRQTLQSEFGF